MKNITSFSAVLLGSLALAEASPTLAFPEVKIDAPPLSLVDGAKQGLPPVFGHPSPHTRAFARPLIGLRQFTGAAQNFISRMPIVAPATSVDSHMLIKTPDESVDNKLIIKIPDMNSVR